MAEATRNISSKFTLVVCYLAIYFIWGSTYLAISVSIRTAPIFLASGIRFACAGGALILIAGFRGARKPTAGNAAIAIQSGALAFFVSYGILSWAQKTLPSSTAALIISLEPAWFVLFDWLFFSGPKPGKRIISAQAAGIAGVVFLVLGEGSSAGELGRSVAEYSLAAIAVSLSGFS
jgi:drug/metabolite transporter (DMT)-like permease